MYTNIKCTNQYLYTLTPSTLTFCLSNMLEVPYRYVYSTPSIVQAFIFQDLILNMLIIKMHNLPPECHFVYC